MIASSLYAMTREESQHSSLEPPPKDAFDNLEGSLLSFLTLLTSHLQLSLFLICV